MRQLARFAITMREDDFVLHIEDDTGEELDFAVTPEQLDVVIEEFDDMLSQHEEEFFGVQHNGATLQRPTG